MKAKKQKKKKFFLKGNLNYWRQNTNCKPIPSLSFPFFIPFGPCSEQAGPSFHTTISDTRLCAQESATGQPWWVWVWRKPSWALVSFETPEADPSESPSLPTALCHLHFQTSKTQLTSTANESNRTRLFLGYFLISSFNRVVSFTCYHSHLKVLHFENVYISGWKRAFEVFLLGNIFIR